MSLRAELHSISKEVSSVRVLVGWHLLIEIVPGKEGSTFNTDNVGIPYNILPVLSWCFSGRFALRH